MYDLCGATNSNNKIHLLCIPSYSQSQFHFHLNIMENFIILKSQIVKKIAKNRETLYNSGWLSRKK